MKYFLLLALFLFSLVAYGEKTDSPTEPPIIYDRWADSAQFHYLAMDSVYLKLEMDFPIQEDSSSVCIRQFLFDAVNISPNDTIFTLSFDQIKPYILPWFIHHNYGDNTLLKNRKPKTFHQAIGLQKAESGVPGITTFSYTETIRTRKDTSLIVTFDYHYFVSCLDNEGKALDLSDIIRVEKQDSVLHLIKERILRQRRDNAHDSNPALYDDILIEARVSIIDNHLHCGLRLNTPKDYNIDFPLHEIKDCLAAKIAQYL